MRNFQRLIQGYDVGAMMHELARHPELWNQHQFRTTYAGTPHQDVDDIWVRFSPLEHCADPEAVGEVINGTDAVWYEAKKALPSLMPTVLTFMAVVRAYSLLRLLITRIRPGGRILPHADVDGAYVNLPDIARYHIILQGKPGSKFRCGSEVVEMLTGEIWWFNAALEHEVLNDSDDDRIHLIADLRLW